MREKFHDNRFIRLIERLLKAGYLEEWKYNQTYIRKLADLEPKGRKPRPEWMKKMSARRRKTLVVCRNCHHNIQYGRYDGNPSNVKVTGKLRDTETVMRSLEEGCWKSIY